MRFGKTCPACERLHAELAQQKILVEHYATLLSEVRGQQHAESDRYERLVEKMSTMVREGYRPTAPMPEAPKPPEIDELVLASILSVCGGPGSLLYPQLMGYAVREMSRGTPAKEIAQRILDGD